MQHASNIAAALAIALAVLGLGGVHTVVVGGAALLALAAASLQIACLRARGHDVLFSLVSISLIGAALLCAAQIVPVPMFVYNLLNPTGMEIYTAGPPLAGVPMEGWRPLSLDAMQTGDRLLRYTALAAIGIWAGNMRGRRRWESFAYGFVPLALAVLGVGYTLWTTDAKSYFGLYEPVVGFRGPSTFISTNHGAAFFGLAMLVGLAAALRLRHDHKSRAVAMAAAALGLGVASLAMDSDGVFVALAITTVVALVVQWMRRGRPRRIGKDVWIGGGLLVVLGTIAAVWLDVHRAVGGQVKRILLGGEHLGRLSLMESGVSALGDFWVFGAGAGSIESILPAYVDWSVVVPASLPVIENDPLEVLLSFGVLFGLLIIAAPLVQCSLIAKRGIDGERSPRYAVALVAGVYILVIAQLHFPLFTLGISLPAVVWFELLWSRRSRSSKNRTIFRTGHVASPWPIAAGICALLGVLSVAGAFAYTTFGPAEELDTTPELTREIELRPASHSAYVKLATQALREGDVETAVKLADFAVTREPSPRVRLYRAQVLARAEDPRGIEEFGALFDEGHRGGRYIERFLTSVSDSGQRVDSLVDHPEMWFDAARRMHRISGPDGVSSFVVELAELRPKDVAVYRLGATVYLEMKQPVLSKLWAELASELEASQGTSRVEAPLLLARALRASGRVDEARQVLDEAVENPALVKDAHRVALELRGAPDREHADFVKRHYDAYCVSPIPAENQRVCWGSEGWLLETSGDHVGAAKVYRRLYRRMNDPVPIAQYFQRSGRCDDLLTLSRELEPGPKRRAIEALRATCAQ